MMPKRGRFFEPLAALVAAGESVRAACDAAGCSVTTGYRTSCQPDFQSRVSAIRTEMMRGSLGKLSASASRAVSTMVELLSCPDDSVRLRAAVAILDRFTSVSEAIDLRERVEALESGRAGT